MARRLYPTPGDNTALRGIFVPTKFVLTSVRTWWYHHHMKEQRLNIRVSKSDKRLYERASAREQMSLSEWLRFHLRNAAEKILGR